MRKELIPMLAAFLALPAAFLVFKSENTTGQLIGGLFALISVITLLATAKSWAIVYTQADRKVLEVLSKGQSLTFDQIQKATGIPKLELTNVLDHLKKHGKAESNIDTSFCWRIKN